MPFPKMVLLFILVKKPGRASIRTLLCIFGLSPLRTVRKLAVKKILLYIFLVRVDMYLRHGTAKRARRLRNDLIYVKLNHVILTMNNIYLGTERNMHFSAGKSPQSLNLMISSLVKN